MMRRGRLAPLAAGALCAVAVAGLGGAMTDTGPWYLALEKPAWKPPGWVFGPVWTVIFACCAWSFAEAWAAARTRTARATVLWLFGFNMFLNLAWSALFFVAQRPDWALVEVALLLPRGDIAAIEHLTGPRTYVEEADEALEAIGIAHHLADKAAELKRP